MNGLEFLFLMLGAAAVLVRLADLVRIPYPIVLVVGGLGIALIPGLPSIELEPEVIFLVFLPPLLYAAAWNSSPRELKAELRPLTLLSIGLVIVTAVAVAVVAHALIPGMGWAAAFILGAVVSPTDPVSAIATFRRVGVPERVGLLVEGESMINDASALVIYRVAVAAAVSGAFYAGDAALDFLVLGAGGIAVGIAIGWISHRIVKRQSDTTLAIFMTVLTAYASYIVAEELHVSGVLAAVVSGLWAGWFQQDAFDADTRLTGIAFRQVMVFGLEATLFVLLGLQFPSLIEELQGELSLSDLLWQALVATAVVIAVRMAWCFIPGARLGDNARERFVIGFTGMRGAISLAAALAVPLTVAERPSILFVTVVVILVTLVGQGLTLPIVIRALGVQGEREWSPDEAIARLETAQAALDRLEEIEQEGADEDQLRRMRELYRARFRKCMEVLGGDRPQEALEPVRGYRGLRRDLIGVERGTLRGLRREGRVRNDVARLIERDLDLDEARLR